MKKKKLFIILVLLAVGVMVFYININQYGNKKFYNEFDELLSLREELIAKIKKNEIELDEYKYVKLSNEYERVATNGKVRVLINDEEETLIGFLYRTGFPDEEQYIFYSTKDENFIKEQIGKSSFNYIERITEDWYFVQYN